MTPAQLMALFDYERVPGAEPDGTFADLVMFASKAAAG